MRREASPSLSTFHSGYLYGRPEGHLTEIATALIVGIEIGDANGLVVDP